MRLGQRLKRFFGGIGRGIRKAVGWVGDKVKKVAKGAVKLVGKAGGALGTAAGGIIGSIVPGAGTAAGAKVGGLIGTGLQGVAQKLTGDG